MSCIAGMFHCGGAPIDHRLVERMLAQMQGRAPDGNQVRCEGPVAFGHALLRTGASDIDEHPISLDGQVWITADARIDGRAELIRSLRSARRPVADDAPHAELILHAYAVFGDKFLDHLIGDFAFALWDTRCEKLICARDHFGVRPFYYFQAGELFGFASNVDALVVHPLVSNLLDEVSVADFLMFSAFQDADRSIYRDIRCLPPASCLELTRGGVRLRTYWDLPRHAETRYATLDQYVEHFCALFELAVGDRLPAGPVAMQFSGGIDSTAIAAVAAPPSRAEQRTFTGYNLSMEALVPEDEERHYAGIAASHLSIPLVCQELGNYALFERSADPELFTDSPILYGHLAAHYDTFIQIQKSGARVLLSGHGGDALMAPSATYYPRLVRNGRLVKLAKEIAHHVRHTGSFGGMGLRSSLWPRPATPAWTPKKPDWIDEAFATRVGLNGRWKNGWQTIHCGIDADRQLRQPWLSRNFEAVEILRAPVVVRYPFYDIRLVRFLLGVPNFLTSGKLILREAMRGKLPESIRLRPKTAMPGDPIRAIVTNSKQRFMSSAGSGVNARTPVVWDRYWEAVDRYCDGDGAESTWSSALILAPLALNFWIAQRQGANWK